MMKFVEKIEFLKILPLLVENKWQLSENIHLLKLERDVENVLQLASFPVIPQLKYTMHCCFEKN